MAGLGGDYLTPDRFEDFQGINLLKAGIQYADAITTVSPNYANEIKGPIGGMGVAALTRYSSGAALAASLAAPIVALAVHQSEVASVFGALAVLLWIKHSPNIERLLTGRETRIGSKGS